MPSLTLDQTIDLGLEHHIAGRLHEAEQLYRQALVLYPNHPRVLQLLGTLAHQAGKSALGVELIRRALVIEPNQSDAWNNLGEILRNTGSPDEATACFQKCLQIDPEHAPAHNNLGEVYRGRKEFERAVRCYRSALEIQSDDPNATNNLAIVMHDLGEMDEAIAGYHRAIALRPNYVNAHNNLGTVLLELRQIEDAMQEFRTALQLDPHDAEVHYNLAQALLLGGEFQQGWEESEWRWKVKSFPSERRNFPQPLWNGENPAGKRILVYAEQGLGDAIEFVRYVPLLAERGASVILECQPELRTLFGDIPGIAQFLACGETLPEFDWQVPMLSLPRAFGTTLQTIPASIPYLHADSELVEKWREKLSPANGRRRVGLCWAGNPNQAIDRFRSLRLNQLAPLAAVKGVEFHSLQKGYASEQAKSPPAGMTLIDHSAELMDFSETAALIANLDLVISTCTSVPHLAGALGKPVWLMLPLNADWRWMVGSEATPWYPTMRLLRQQKFGEWEPVIQRVAEELSKESSR